MVTLICQHCENNFAVKAYRSQTAKCCSRACLWHITKVTREPLRLASVSSKKAFNNQQVSKICLHCKLEFFISPSRDGVKKFCSKKCYAAAMSLNAKQSYKRITINGVRMLEHRYIMERHIDRKLETREHVHHINHDRLDNRIENLEILDWIDHGKKHTRKSF